ncbi:protein FANTASTIC FOUR 1-like [Beta vulgaris subsp. vulgaris]|uniref:protein FANTASTIC FOUR 1-like n=1 Tax=Beta vulgaris subsp. vulgaris TaxID=3555 RepID=UPI002036CA30|nr:protein FANTASTIC FOUR 1-like [Beta vulgaris subsp. vulgaris]
MSVESMRKKGCDPSTSSPSVRGTYYVGKNSEARTVDWNSENPRVKPEPQTPPRGVKRARYQAFEDEFILEDYHVASNLRIVTNISDDEGNNRTFIAMIKENQVAPVLDIGIEKEGVPNEDEPTEGDPIKEEPEEEEEPIEEEEEEPLEEEEPIEDDELVEDEAGMEEGLENPE